MSQFCTLSRFAPIALQALDVDMFGAVVDVAKPAEVNLNHWKSVTSTAASASAADHGPLVIDGFVVPPKFSHALHSVAVRCGVEYVDVEGRADKQSVVHLMESVAPITSVILRGSAAAKEFLRQQCSKHSARVVVASNDVAYDVSSKTVMFNARIWDDAFNGLKFQSVGPLEAAFVDAEWEGSSTDGTLALRQHAARE